MRKSEKAHFGQIIMSETSPDRSSHLVDQDEALMGRKMKGGVLDISHSIGGEPEEVQTYNDVKAKPRPFRGDSINKAETKQRVGPRGE